MNWNIPLYIAILVTLVTSSLLMILFAYSAILVYEPTDNDDVETLELYFEHDYFDFDIRLGDVEGYEKLIIPRQCYEYFYEYKFITVHDANLLRLHDLLEERMNGYDDEEKANALCRFVYYNVGYTLDSDLFGIDDYCQYPLETLYRGMGDCEDQAVLLMTLLEMSEIDCVAIMTSAHHSVGVAVDAYGYFVNTPFSDTAYYTLEATGGSPAGASEYHGLAYHPTLLLSFISMIIGAILMIILLRIFCLLSTC